MARIVKVIELVASSESGWEAAVQAALQEASRTIRGITGMEVTNMTVDVQDNRITQYRATVKVAFVIEGAGMQD